MSEELILSLVNTDVAVALVTQPIILEFPSTVKGDSGISSTIAVGTVTVGPTGAASITNVGSAQNSVFNFVIPQAAKGDAATVSVGTVTTVNPATSASVTNVGTSAAAILNFSIPQGIPGVGATPRATVSADGSVPSLVAAGAGVGQQSQMWLRGDLSWQPIIPPGTVWAYAGGAAPTGWLLCQGQSLATTGTYANLFAAVAYTYGGSGANFNVPDCRGNTIIGAGTNAVNSIAYSLGVRGGEANHLLSAAEMPIHTHGQNAHTHTDGGHLHGWIDNGHVHLVPAHSHSDAGHSHVYTNVTYTNSAGLTVASTNSYTGQAANTATSYANIQSNGPWWSGSNNQAVGYINWGYAGISTNTATNQNAGGGASHNTMPPYIPLNYIIHY